MKDQGYIVRIPEPCHEDWNSMQPDAKGKFCSSCSKVVFDFSNKTDTEIRDLLISYKDQKVCGHFKKTQVDRPLNITVHFNDLPKNVSSTKSFAIAVFLVFGTLLFSCTHYDGKKIGEVEMVSTARENYLTGEVPPPTELMGDVVVVEQDSLPPKQKGEVDPVDSLEIDTETHIAGGLMFEPIPDEIVPDIVCPPDSQTNTPGLMGKIKIVLPEPKDTSRVSADSSGLRIFNTEKDQPVFNESGTSLLVYPNPGSGDFTIRYEVLRRSDVRIDIFDLHGAWLKTLANTSGQYAGRYQFPLDVSCFANGVYLVNMINEGKRLTTKLIIEK
ncbi:MAG: T9SS type A sorting domain-containing protein [Bacteroidota bacterium]